LTYVISSTTPGAGTPSIANALTQFESVWYTLVVNSYGASQLAALEAFNGIPDPVNPTGQYLPQVFMPFLSFFGSTDPVAADLISITNATARVNQVTNILCPAPGSGVMPYEAAAAMCLLFANVAQSNPHLTVAGQSYIDIPPAASNMIGDLANYANRNNLKANGCSTVMLVNGAFQVQDLVTTYHPTGEIPLVFNEARYLNIDWNVYYGYNLLQIAHLNDKTIVADGQNTTVQNVIRPSDWKAILYTYMDTLASLALITDSAFSKSTIMVEIDPSNPNRFNTTFSYQRTGTSEIESTTVTVGF
jgi:phage tail sheath gpL-like